LGKVAESSLEAGREAVARRAWREGFELLSGIDESDGLGAEDLERLAHAAWWTGHLDGCISARERAYSAYVESGDRRGAARVAMDVAKDYYAKQTASVGSGWVRQAERLLEGEEDCVEHGYLARLRGVIAFEGAGDFDLALEQAQRTLEIGERFANRDLQAVGLHDRGRALVAKGEVEEGLPLLDEGTAAAVSGELGPMATGVIFCNMIATCEQLGDYRRAGEWSEAAKRWCERQAIAGFPGICRVHRAEVMRLRGAWPEAEQEARRAIDELREFNLEAAAEAFYEVGEVRLRVGDLHAAEEAFSQANELGREPEPGMALLRLAEGKLDAAVACIKRALSEETRDLGRARLLPTHAELSIAAADPDEARAATEELEATAAKYGTVALEAGGAHARGSLHLSEGKPAEAVRSLRGALRLWREIDLPYEAARTRLRLAEAYRAEGDLDSALLELRSARSAFEQLGALPDERRAAGLLRDWLGEEDAIARLPGLRGPKTFMFTDIVRSTKLVEAIGDEAWEDLVRWHDRTLRSLFAEHQGQEIDHAGDGFFVGFDGAGDALACAVAVQRTLDRHRRASGFAPQVRIGVHTADATRAGSTYRGRGVHEAARIAQLSEGAQILASEEVLRAGASRFPVSEPRTVDLEGISRPIELRSVEWR
jgi:class 3 adenylate cyclase